MSHPPLPEGFLLEDCRIERQLSQGGFSVVYLAHDAAGKAVAIKEYLPAGMAHRGADGVGVEPDAEHRAAFSNGLKCFFDEGRILAGMNTATIIARPTAASAAATVMVKNTNNCPCMELR